MSLEGPLIAEPESWEGSSATPVGRTSIVGVEARIFDVEPGAELARTNGWPLVAAITGSTAVAYTQEPYPRLSLYDVNALNFSDRPQP